MLPGMDGILEVGLSDPQGCHYLHLGANSPLGRWGSLPLPLVGPCAGLIGSGMNLGSIIKGAEKATGWKIRPQASQIEDPETDPKPMSTFEHGGLGLSVPQFPLLDSGAHDALLPLRGLVHVCKEACGAQIGSTISVQSPGT